MIVADYPKELYQSKFYQVWNNMLTRCYNPKNNRFGFYKNINVCAKWMTFAGFYEDMYGSYQEGLTPDRINNHGDYKKSNCRWATYQEQARNTRNVEGARRYTYKGLTKTVLEWSEITGTKRTTLGMRLQHRGWSIDEALTGKRG